MSRCIVGALARSADGQASKSLIRFLFKIDGRRHNAGAVSFAQEKNRVNACSGKEQEFQTHPESFSLLPLNERSFHQPIP